MNACNHLIITLLLLLSSAMAVFAADRFRVTDDVLTVYGEPERINALGKLHKGDEYEIVGQDGNMYIFMYNGKKAYAASYCCKLIESAASAAEASDEKIPPKVEYARETDQKCDPETDEPGASADLTKGEDASSPEDDITETVGIDNGSSRSFRDVLEEMKGLLGLLVVIGLAAGLWSLIGPSSFDAIFDRLAGRVITDCPKLMYCRPAIAVIIFGLAGKYSGSVGVALAVAAVYECALLCFRARKLQSFRAAVAEALYLLFSDMGLLLLFWLFIIFAFLASGGPSGSSKSSGDGNNAKSGNSGDDCRDCDHGPGSPWCIGTPMAGYKCMHYRQRF